jgi:hypothetical protein
MTVEALGKFSGNATLKLPLTTVVAVVCDCG